jgi:hypothetical protein
MRGIDIAELILKRAVIKGAAARLEGLACPESGGNTGKLKREKPTEPFLFLGLRFLGSLHD